MQKITIIFITLFFAFSATAQTTGPNGKLESSKKMKGKKYKTIHQVAGQDDDGVYVVKSSVAGHVDNFVRKPILERYDERLNLVHSQKLKTRAYPGVFVFEDLVHFGGELIMFFTTVKNGQNIFYQKVNKKTLQVMGEPVLVAQSKLPLIFKPEMLKKLSIVLSPNKEKLMVFFRHSTGGSKNATFDMTVLGKGMEKEWAYVAMEDIENRYVTLTDASIDNEGQIHLVANIKGTNREVKQEGKAESRMFLKSFHAGSQLASTELVSSYDPFSQMKLGFDVQGDMYCIGFYTHKEEKDGLVGTYSLKLDPRDHSTLHEEYNPFTESLLVQGHKPEKVKGESTLGGFNIQELLAYSDGTMGLIAEEQSHHLNFELRTPNSQLHRLSPHQAMMQQQRDFIRQSGGKETNHYGNLMLVKFDEEGREQWSEKILKNHSSKDMKDFYGSFGVAFIKDNVYMLFNDNIKNFDVEYLEDRKRITSKKNNQMVMVGIDRDGKKSKTALAQTKDVNAFLRPTVTRQLENNHLLLFGQNKSKYWMGRLEFSPGLATN